MGNIRETLGNMCIIIVCESDRDVINIGINLIFLIKALFLHDGKTKTKFKLLQNEKRFFIFFKGLPLKQIKEIVLEGESPTLRV